MGNGNSANKQAFLGLINEHQRIIRSLCCIYYAHEADRLDAEQDIILQLWKSFSTFRGDSNVKTWLYKVSLNTLLSKKKVENRGIQKMSLQLAGEIPRQQMGLNDDDLQFLQQLMSLLSDKDRSFLILRLEGYSNKEIAQMLSTTPSNVSTRMNRIIQLLKTKATKHQHG